MKSRVAVLFVIIISFIVIPAQAVVQYSITDLGTLGGIESDAYAINDSGHVVGYSTTIDGIQHAFCTAANQSISPATDDLGTLGGTFSYAYGLNNSEQVVGYAQTSGNSAWHAFRTAANQPINPATDDLGTLGGTKSRASTINDNGQTIGEAYTSGGIYRAFRTAANQPINPATDDLGTLGGTDSYARGINNSGQVAGFSKKSSGRSHAYRTAANQPINPATDDLGTLGGFESTGIDINDIGQVVGSAENSNRWSHAFRTAANQPINPATDDLGTLGGLESSANSINNSGQVVGYSSLSNGYIHAFIYSGTGSMQDLNDLIDSDSGWTLLFAHGINDSGQIVGYGTIGDSAHRAFLLTPIPEPSTLALLGMGGIGLIAYGWRRRKAHRIVVCFIALLASAEGMAKADVFNMGGTRNPTTGTWTGVASLEFVTVGDAGNAADSTGFGSVSYNYQIGKYDVTVAQYAAFLNAVARTDTYDLYDPFMASGSVAAACGISRNGSPGNYTYSITKNGNYPVNYISWGDATRFCNWLSNGQPTGDQGPGITETGAYTLNGATSDAALMAVTRNAGTTYFIPSEDEWYKAAYYKGGGTNAGYWLYPTISNTAPINTLPDTGNHANFYAGGYTDPTNRLTAVGAFSASPGPYGTYDQSGNVFQWNEANNAGLWRGVRGGSFINGPGTLASSSSNFYYPKYEDIYIGFRVASVPEPSTLALLFTVIFGGLLWWRRKR